MLAIDHDEYFLYPHYEPVLHRLQIEYDNLRTSRKRKRALEAIKAFAGHVVNIEYPSNRHPHLDWTFTR